MNINPYVVLIRPANIITAISDILAGSAIAGCRMDEPENRVSNGLHVTGDGSVGVVSPGPFGAIPR